MSTLTRPPNQPGPHTASPLGSPPGLRIACAPGLPVPVNPRRVLPKNSSSSRVNNSALLLGASGTTMSEVLPVLMSALMIPSEGLETDHQPLPSRSPVIPYVEAFGTGFLKGVHCRVFVSYRRALLSSRATASTFSPPPPDETHTPPFPSFPMQAPTLAPLGGGRGSS